MLYWSLKIKRTNNNLMQHLYRAATLPNTEEATLVELWARWGVLVVNQDCIKSKETSVVTWNTIIVILTLRGAQATISVIKPTTRRGRHLLPQAEEAQAELRIMGVACIWAISAPQSWALKKVLNWSLLFMDSLKQLLVMVMSVSTLRITDPFQANMTKNYQLIVASRSCFKRILFNPHSQWIRLTSAPILMPERNLKEFYLTEAIL